MNEALLIWLYFAFGNLLDWMTDGLTTILALTIIAIFPVSVLARVEKGGDEILEIWRKYYPIKSLIAFTVITVLLSSAYPSKEDLKWIIGGALVWNGVQSATQIEGINELPENLVNAANSFLESISDKEE